MTTEKRENIKPEDVMYSINFDELEGVHITKDLTAFDKRVYVAIGALFNCGNEIMTVQQIGNAMGNAGKVGGTSRKKINASITKMATSNLQEYTVCNNRIKFEYNSSLLPMEFINCAIHAFREPPLISFAKKHKQIITIERRLLESPIRKTDENLKIDDYLINCISRAKSDGKIYSKILFETIYKVCDINTYQQKNRVPDKTKIYMEHYKKCGFIEDFSMEKDGVNIIYQQRSECMATEKNFENQVKHYLDDIGAWYVKFFANAYTKRGVPDILACYDGLFFGIEVKAPTGTPSLLQLDALRKIRDAGGYGILLYPEDFDEFKKFIKDDRRYCGYCAKWYFQNVRLQGKWENKLLK